MASRLPLSECGLSTGKKARLDRILFHHGVGNGTAIFLPYDQGLEHGPRDFFANPAAGDPSYIVKLAVEGGFNGIAIQVGLAEKFYWEYAGEVPLSLKIKGKTGGPPTTNPSHRSTLPSRTPCGSVPTPSVTRCTSARPCRRRTSSSSATCAP